MDKKLTFKSVLTGKDHFKVRVYPNIDYAFIVALILILDRMRSKVKKIMTKMMKTIVKHTMFPIGGN